MPASENLLNRIRGEYLEMPGLRLTPAQAARLWAVDLDRVRVLLSGLVDAGFLMQAGEGQYARRGDSDDVAWRFRRSSNVRTRTETVRPGKTA